MFKRSKSQWRCLVYCFRSAHSKHVREGKLQSFRHEDVLQLQCFRYVSSAKKKKEKEHRIKKNLKQLNAWNNVASSVCPVENYSRANSFSEVFSSSLNKAGSSFWAYGLVYSHLHTHTVKRALRLGDPTWWPFVISSSPALFAQIIWKHRLLSLFWRCGEKKRANKIQMILIYWGAPLKHKMERWWKLGDSLSVFLCWFFSSL